MRVLPCLALTATLAACGTAPALNELHLENDGGGRFSGKAGPEWTGTELKQEVATAICGGTDPARFRLKTPRRSGPPTASAEPVRRRR